MGSELHRLTGERTSRAYSKACKFLRMDIVSEMPSEVVDLSFAQADIRDFMAWRSTCRAAYALGVESLRRRLRTLLVPYALNPSELIDLVGRCKALFGGLFAMAFMLRSDPVQFKILEIFASDLMYYELRPALVKQLKGKVKTGPVRLDGSAKRRRKVADCTVFVLEDGRRVVLYQSVNWSPLWPICASPCTALFNYVSPWSFGCAYPELTLVRRGLVADQSMRFFLPFDFAVLQSLADNGVDVSWSPGRFAREDYLASLGMIRSGSALRTVTAAVYHAAGIAFAAGPTGTLADAIVAAEFRRSRGEVVPVGWDRRGRAFRLERECYASVGMCPRELRYFGDEGSFVDFVDGLSGDRALLEEGDVAPFGTVISWRLGSSYLCTRREVCWVLDAEGAVVRDGVVWLPAVPGLIGTYRRVDARAPPTFLYHQG